MLYHEKGLWCWLSSPWLSQTGVVPVHSPECVQFLWADPDRVNPSWQEKLCVIPTRNHWSLGQKSPWSSWSWAGHNKSGSRREVDGHRRGRRMHERHCEYFDERGNHSNHYLCKWPVPPVCHWLISWATTPHQHCRACGWQGKGTGPGCSDRSAHCPAALPVQETHGHCRSYIKKHEAFQ